MENFGNWGSTGQPMAGDRGPLLPVIRPLDKAPVRTLGVGEKVSRLTLEQERVGVSVCKSDGAVLVEQGGTLLPVLKSCPLGLLRPILTGPIGAPFRACTAVSKDACCS
jgi:hypothetical protein